MVIEGFVVLLMAYSMLIIDVYLVLLMVTNMVFDGC